MNQKYSLYEFSIHVIKKPLHRLVTYVHILVFSYKIQLSQVFFKYFTENRILSKPRMSTYTVTVCYINLLQVTLFGTQLCISHSH